MHESVALLYYENMKIDMERTESYIASPDWLRNKGATINPRNKDDNKCFQYAITLALTYNKIRKKELKSIPKKIKQVNIYFSSYQKDWEKFEQNNTSIALNVLFSSQNNEEIKLAYKSEHSFKRENTMVLSMTNDNDNDYDDEKYYFAVKSKAELFASEWLRSKKEAIINGGNGFQNALNDALDYQKNKRDPQKTLKIEPYISKQNWEGIEFPSDAKDSEKFEQNNKTIALNILFVPYNTKTIRVAYKSEYNHKCKNQVILLMITDGNKWHYIAVSKLSALLKGKSSNHIGDFHCLNCFNSYSTENALKEHEQICNKHDRCRKEMPK